MNYSIESISNKQKNFAVPNVLKLHGKLKNRVIIDTKLFVKSSSASI